MSFGVGLISLYLKAIGKCLVLLRAGPGDVDGFDDNVSDDNVGDHGRHDSAPGGGNVSGIVCSNDRVCEEDEHDSSSENVSRGVCSSEDGKGSRLCEEHGSRSDNVSSRGSTSESDNVLRRGSPSESDNVSRGSCSSEDPICEREHDSRSDGGSTGGRPSDGFCLFFRLWRSDRVEKR